MTRRILLFAILAGTPVAETQAEFLFSDLDPGARYSEGAGTSSEQSPNRDLPVPPDYGPETRPGIAGRSAGMDSTSTTSGPGSTPAGALAAAVARLTHDDVVSYLLGESGCRYQAPCLAGPIKPPREAC